jgi:signal transduction histidine kinase
MLRQPKRDVEGRTLDLAGLSRGIIELSPLPMAAVEGKEHIVRHINPSFCRLVGRKGEELIGYPFAKAVPEADGGISLLDRVSLTGKAEIYALEKQFGSDTISWSCAVWPVLAADEKPAGLIIQLTDMTEATLFRQKVAAMNEELLLANVRQHELMEEELRKANEILEVRIHERTAELAGTNEALRHLSTKLLSAQEDERKKIASDLHDTLGASLAAIKFKVERALEQIGDPANAASESLNTIIPEIQEAIEECRRIQMDLRPSMLDDLGLLPALSWFFRRFRSIYSGVRIEHEIDIQEGAVPHSLKIVAFRVIQEAMNNTAKHSQADLVRLSLRKKDSSLELILRDNGRGFNLEKAGSQETTTRGLGLTSMRERTELSGGSFWIESIEGKGTIIRASWPLRENG